MTQPAAPLDQIRDGVMSALQEIAGRSVPPLYDMVRYHLGFIDRDGRPSNVGGKILRPVFCCLACAAVCGDWRRATAAACAIELTHNFSLVHDDIEDGDLERRHRATVWSLWGVPQAINTGDAIWALAWETLAQAIQAGVPPETVVECNRRLATRCREMIEGQYLDLALEGKVDIGPEQYLQIVEGKTGALLACSFELGALCGGADAALADAYAHAGRLLGVAFQMQDDILGVWGDPAATGKAADTDVRRKKMALPAVCGFQNLHAESREVLRGIYLSEQPLSDLDIATVLDLFEEAGAREAAERLAREYTDQAHIALQALPRQGGDSSALSELAESLVGRRA
jgi:geranylgeranyl diphosphate synthase type I